jgi:hypothetical protein
MPFEQLFVEGKYYHICTIAFGRDIRSFCFGPMWPLLLVKHDYIILADRYFGWSIYLLYISFCLWTIVFNYIAFGEATLRYSILDMLLVKQIRWDFCFGWSKSFSFALLFLVRRIYFDLYLRREAHLSLFCSIALGAAITFPLTLRLSICFQLTDAPTGLYFELLSYAIFTYAVFGSAICLIFCLRRPMHWACFRRSH